MKVAARRAANRRGSSTTIFFPANQGSSKSAGGTRVVLPVPGAAESATGSFAAKAAFNSVKSSPMALKIP